MPLAICARESSAKCVKRSGTTISRPARSLHYQLFELNQAVFFDTNPIPIKYMMKRLGILPTNEHRLPMMPATEELQKRLDAVLLRVGLLKASQAV